MKGKNRSLRKKVKYSYFLLIFVLMIPAVSSIIISQVQRSQYDKIITNVNRANYINQIIKNDVPNELWNVVSGKQSFVLSGVYVTLSQARKELNQVMELTYDEAGSQKLEVAYRCLQTLYRNVDSMEKQILSGASVQQNQESLDEIRSITSLFADIMQGFIVYEIESAALTNHNINKFSIILLIVQFVIVLFTLYFSMYGYKSLSYNIYKPIEQMREFTSQIASGNLEAKVEIPKIDEFDELAQNLNSMAEQIKQLIELNVMEQKNLRKAELRTLQAQITPHFLYNTFDTIIWLSEEGKTEDVIKITRAFSSFLRTSLSRGHDWITVKQEVEHIQNYLTIQKVRYVDILNYEIDVDPELEEFSILKLTLQPLVENAIYHGIKKRRGRGILKITGRFEENKKYMTFSITDNGAGFTQERLEEVLAELKTKETDTEKRQSVYGLYNVNKRLILYYNNQTQGVRIESEVGKGSTVSFTVPCILQAGDLNV